MIGIRRAKKQLVGKRVSVRAYNWEHRLTGELLKVGTHFFILRCDNGPIMAIMNRSAGEITAIDNGREEANIDVG